MAFGPGKYDSACTKVRQETQATSILLVVQGGIWGNGFSVQSSDIPFLLSLPEILRSVADEIERSGIQA